ncbi:MAG TPA: sulfate ABC transporter substrate-binding protein [Phycisphaerae bacterium]|nr:sulfate ABC transporter substrate-binding protein [Phycisphaerae bacterium]HOM52252.1 sulfate ABC transporter substrate-binding protein [Phycisphaerae bacterium]HPP24964.1 sulfate ABC transporter substrate-binding protein [Phycisphaerae bacterium]HPU28194.1 sulfate ABC transporter substrate-binding protein [Phycisphaerae bacterium]
MRYAVGIWSVWAFGAAALAADPVTLLNVSYDPTREFYQEINALFAKEWEAKHGQKVTIRQSHSGSGKQARAVIDGLEADVVTLAVAQDIDEIASRSGRVRSDWQQAFKFNSSPYTSTIVLLVRKGNPKGIKDWDDLARPGIGVITPNPKTGGGARWNYLAAWGYAVKKHNGDEVKARELVAAIFRNVPVLDPSARAATTTFVQRRIGDVLITWENEARLAIEQLGRDQLEIVLPSVTILAEPPVAVVDRVVDKRGTRAVATAYLEFLYSEKGQELAAKHHYRPRDPKVAQAYADKFPKIETFTIEELFGGWAKAQKVHFDDGGTFDQIYSPRR